MTSETDERETELKSRGWPIGHVVAGSLIVGLLLAVTFTLLIFGGAEENVISGSALLSFAVGWTLLAAFSIRFTAQPQRWPFVAAGLMALAGVVLVVWPGSVQHETFSWIWPPVAIALVVWMIVTSRRDLQSRTRPWLLYPVFAVIALGAVGGAYEAIQERLDKNSYDMPGELVDVGGHRLHLVCTGTGSPTVILEAGLGELSAMMTAWIAPDVAKDTQVCAYDRAGRGWSESAPRPQDGVEVATDLHTLMRNAGIAGPYVLAGHSSGGAYVLNFANLYPDEVAGVVLLDSMHPEQYSRISDYPRFYMTFRRASAVLPSLARIGSMRLLNEFNYGGLPSEQRDVERAFWSTPRHARSERDEFSTLRETLDQAGQLKSLGSKPLIVVTAESGAQDGWMPLQDELAALSTNSVHRILSNASHSSLTEDEGDAALSAKAITDVVDSVRASTPLAQ